ncbi:MAG: FliM/FliN family flagellar motor switch protein [Buchnera aphidicola (Pentalonia nigronervosa)]|jgi:flagellar motor switch protein FliM|uniref:Flagellar motor switch protein FliM n=1 Tax=Buchnera aphidicola (Pentalonia nigronervosa) TaxID=1309793 RepID=A0A7H1AZB8_9GAMM|nr:MAG: FliM/FliN family flagellar motor switch protein [Buchnera aphidicola (Pentalonia nigronervosa)]
MGKSNNMHDTLKNLCQHDQNLNSFLAEKYVKKIEHINKIFIEKTISAVLKLFNFKICLISSSIKIESYDKIKKFAPCSIIKILPLNNRAFITFSSNFFSVLIERLFGGHDNFASKVKKNTDITLSEKCIRSKIMKLIITAYSSAYHEFYPIDFIDLNVSMILKKTCFNSNKIFLINFFSFNVFNTEIFFSIFVPLSALHKFNNMQHITKKVNEKIIKNNLSSNISFVDIHDVELNISVNLIDFFIPCSQVENLIKGSVISIDKPEKTIAYLENKPIFFSNYKIFHERIVVFVKKFIKKT